MSQWDQGPINIRGTQHTCCLNYELLTQAQG